MLFFKKNPEQQFLKQLHSHNLLFFHHVKSKFFHSRNLIDDFIRDIPGSEPALQDAHDEHRIRLDITSVILQADDRRIKMNNVVREGECTRVTTFQQCDKFFPLDKKKSFKVVFSRRARALIGYCIHITLVSRCDGACQCHFIRI